MLRQSENGFGLRESYRIDRTETDDKRNAGSTIRVRKRNAKSTGRSRNRNAESTIAKAETQRQVHPSANLRRAVRSATGVIFRPIG